MTTVILFIISFFSLYYLVLRIINKLIYKDQDAELIENIKKHETRTGGLHSDYKYGEANNKKNERQ